MPGPSDEELVVRAYPDVWGGVNLRAVYNSAINDVALLMAGEVLDMINSLDDHISAEDIARTLEKLPEVLEDLKRAP